MLNKINFFFAPNMAVKLINGIVHEWFDIHVVCGNDISIGQKHATNELVDSVVVDKDVVYMDCSSEDDTSKWMLTSREHGELDFVHQQ